MQRSVIAICAVLAFVATVQAQNICAPPAGSVNFTCVADSVIEQGYLSLDFRQNAMAANVSFGFDQNGDPIFGSFIFVNGTGFWIADGECNQVQSNVIPMALLRQCLPAGGTIVTGNVAGVESATFIEFGSANATLVTVAVEQPYNIPVSHMFSSFATSTDPAFSYSLTYTNAIPSTQASYFVLPSSCNAPKVVPLKSIPAAHRMMMHMRFF